MLVSVARDATNILKSLARSARPPTTNFSQRTRTQAPLSGQHRTSRGSARTKTGGRFRPFRPKLRPGLPSCNINQLLSPYRTAPGPAYGQRGRSSAAPKLRRSKRVPTGKDAIAERAEHVGGRLSDRHPARP